MNRRKTTVGIIAGFVLLMVIGTLCFFIPLKTPAPAEKPKPVEKATVVEPEKAEAQAPTQTGKASKVSFNADVNQALAFARKKLEEANKNAKTGKTNNFNVGKEGGIVLK